MGVITVHFQGTICHAIADSPAIQRALVPNGEHVDGIPPHRARLYLKKNEVDVTSLDGLNPQSLGEYYFVYVGGHEVGIENLAEKSVSKDVKFKEFTPGLKQAVPSLALNPSAYTSSPDRNFISAYMQLSGKLDACRTERKAKFNGDARRNFADIVTMTTKSSDQKPILFLRSYTSTSRHRIPMKVEKPTIFVTNDPEALAHDHARGTKKAEVNHFLLHYRVASPIPQNPPVPHDPGPIEQVSCPRVPIVQSDKKLQQAPLMADGHPDCSNSSYP